jgi:ammonia channel protein AmtB
MSGSDTTWLLISTALVMLMTPGLALFYGGMVQSKNVLSTFMHSFIALGLVSVQFALIGYSLAFGPTHAGVIGGFDYIGLAGITEQSAHGTVPHLAFVAYQCMFAVITPALISGAFAERMKFSAFILFTLAWTTLVYDPIAHWVWGEGGWLAKLGAIDYAGGTGLAVGIVLGADVVAHRDLGESRARVGHDDKPHAVVVEATALLGMVHREGRWTIRARESKKPQQRRPEHRDDHRTRVAAARVVAANASTAIAITTSANPSGELPPIFVVR